MPFHFRDSYALEQGRKRRESAQFQTQKELSLKITTQLKANRYDSARQQNTNTEAEIADLQNDLNAAESSLANRLTNLEQLQDVKQTELDAAILAMDNAEIARLTSEIANIENQKVQAEGSVENIRNDISAKQTSLEQNRQQLQAAEFDLIRQVLQDNKDLNGENKNLNGAVIFGKFQALKNVNPNLNPLTFVQQEIAANPPTSPVKKISDATQRLANSASRFRNIVEGRPDGQKAGLEARDPFAIFEPSVCGLIAMDNEGSILTDTKFNLPFQYIWDIKDSKSSSYTEITPMGRFEPHRAYTAGGPYTISFELAYMAYDSGANKDEGYIQEMKDRWLATQYPTYGKNQQNGVVSYGTPNKFLLNIFSRYVNIPVVVEEVSISAEHGLDPATWFAMGFSMSVTLKTSYRLAQVISADSIVTRGLRTYSHKFF